MMRFWPLTGVLVASFCTVSISYSIRYGYGMLLPEMLDALAISKVQAGSIYASYFLVYTVFTPLLGTFSDFFRYRLILLIFLGLLAVGAMLMSRASTVSEAAAFFALAGLGHAACWAPVVSLVQHWAPVNRRGLALSVITMGVGFGLPLWSWLLPWLVSSYSWQMAWLALGAGAGAVMLVNFFLLRDPVNPASTGAPRTPLMALREALAIYRRLVFYPSFWLVGLAYLLVGFNVLVPFTFLPVYGREVVGLELADAAGLVGMIALFGVLGQLTIGPLSDRVGRVAAMTVCGGIMGLSCIAMGMAEDLSALQFSAAAFGLGYGAIWPVYAAAATDLFPQRLAGSVVGLWTVLLGLGSIVSPVVCGTVIDLTGNWFLIFALGLGSGCGSAIILLVGRRTLCRADF